MHQSAKGIRDNPRSGRKRIGEETLRELKSFALTLGVSEIGYTRVNRNFIFRGFEILYDNAIIFTMKMNKEIIDTSPSNEAGREIWRTYANLGTAVNRIAGFLRERGLNCQASPAAGGDIATVPTAQDANLGCIGKSGILITPEHGPCVRLAAVFADVEDLPIARGNDHLWISDFCESCNRCVQMCPGGAIHRYPALLTDGSRVFVDPEKCAPFFSNSCSICVSSCVFTGGNYERIKKGWLLRHAKK
jgi:epoxyqueuosine reductase QueG